MSPEERFTKMENLLLGMMEHQSRQQEQLDKQDAEINKQNAGIRDLIVISRTILTTIQNDTRSFLESQKEVTRQILQNTEQIKELRKAQAEAQAATDEKLNILIDTVDRIIRSRENGKQQ